MKDRRSVRAIQSWDARDLVRTAAKPRVLFAFAFLVRLAAIPLSLVRINPYSTADVTQFSAAASLTATRMSHRVFMLSGSTRTNEMWGAVLSPFWLLPGSQVFAHVFVALLGAITVWNVAVIVDRLSRSRGTVLLAALPLAIYPSIVFVQSTILRDPAVLFGITTAARVLLSAYSRGIGREALWRVLVAVVALAFATVLRSINISLYAAAFVAAIVAIFWQSWWTKVVTALAAPVGVGIAFLHSNQILERFNRLRRNRARGRAIYLPNIRFDHLLGAGAFTPIGATYFLFAPFPWMVSSVRDVPVAVEGVLTFVYVVAAFVGFVVMWRRDRVASTGLAMFVVLGVAVYSLATVNYGTAARHRQMFLWVIFIFGSVGLVRLWKSFGPRRGHNQLTDSERM